MKKVAVFLAGSGFRDGSEIRESVAVLTALSQEGLSEQEHVQCFAPDLSQADVINCLTDQVEENQTRNVLVESARIARGEIRPLSQFKSDDFDAVIVPGGFGVAKNLCNFASKGAQAEVHPEVRHALEKMVSARKPVGAICIAPVLIALTFPNKGIELTLGAQSEASQEIEKLGHSHRVCAANGCHVDESFKIVSSPAYMVEKAPLKDIFLGIHKLVKEVLSLS